jgi:undecaprenyl-diphosphatase
VNALRAAVLGVLQGAGEFLPISSSGHLIVLPFLMGWPDSGLAFDVALHLGTLAAVAFAFWRDWLRC